MSRGAGTIEGWPAVAWVAGTGLALLIPALVFYVRVRRERSRARADDAYRSVPTQGSDDDFRLVMLLLTLVVSQLLYVGVYIEAAGWIWRKTAPPNIQFDLFAWVVLIVFSVVLGAVVSAIKERRERS